MEHKDLKVGMKLHRKVTGVRGEIITDINQDAISFYKVSGLPIGIFKVTDENGVEIPGMIEMGKV